MATTQLRFEALRDEVLASFPEASLKDTMAANLNGMFEAPRVAELEFCLQKRFSEDEARHLMFFPTEDQYRLYALLIADAPDGAPKDHPQRRLQGTHMCMMYVVHSNGWPFLREFVLHGGLLSLVHLFVHENLYLRGQAVECFLRVTGHADFDWFDPPPSTERIAQLLHRQLLSLGSSPFIKNVMRNYANEYGYGSVCVLRCAVCVCVCVMRRVVRDREQRDIVALTSPMSSLSVSL
jgi:hypothetical protein